jgi:uncharacterized membrane-anchored protein YitT (DUF2179 family)
MFGYKIMGKAFVLKSLFATTVLTIFLMIVPIPTTPIVGDYLTACIVGGIVCGYACGLMLRSRLTGGGQDVIGMCLTKLYPGFSVGKVNIAINGLVYLICFLLFDVEIVIYSLIFATVQSLPVMSTKFTRPCISKAYSLLTFRVNLLLIMDIPRIYP